jgi:hypothetical protein
MPVTGLSIEEMTQTLQAFESCQQNMTRAAQKLNIARPTLQSRLRTIEKIGFKLPDAPEIVLPDLPDDDIDAREIIKHACESFKKRDAFERAVRWFPVKMRTNEPIGVAFIGDPHIDDSGTNWPLLQDHIEILEKTPGLYAIGCNDIANNWVGRLMRLYADQNMSRKRALKLAHYLLAETDIKWLCHVLGNHDAWNEGAAIYRMMAKQKKNKNSALDAPQVPVLDWEAKFQLEFPNSRNCRIWMAHDFPGNSQWNSLHGPQKTALMRDEAHIYACAHKHCWAMHQEEHHEREFTYWLIRSRGYKFLDKYALVHGFGTQREGATITAVIDPKAEGATFVHCFSDLGEAAEYLTWKRQRKS